MRLLFPQKRVLLFVVLTIQIACLNGVNGQNSISVKGSDINLENYDLQIQPEDIVNQFKSDEMPKQQPNNMDLKYWQDGQNKAEMESLGKRAYKHTPSIIAEEKKSETPVYMPKKGTVLQSESAGQKVTMKNGNTMPEEQAFIDAHNKQKEAVVQNKPVSAPVANTDKSAGSITGYTENFDDNTLTNWWNDAAFTLTEANGELQVDVDKSDWVSFGIDFSEAVNLVNHPYLSIRLKSETDVNIRTSLIDEYGTWADGNNGGFFVPAGDYVDFFMDFSDRWYNWQNLPLNDTAITGLGLHVNFGDAFTGTIFIDDIQIGDQANLPTGEITFSVNMNYYIDEGMFDPLVDSVEVIGSFNDWNGSGAIVDADEDGIYSITYGGFTYGDFLEYKFRLNGSWDAPHDFPGGPNRTHTFIETTELLSWLNDEYIDIQPFWFNEPLNSCQPGNNEPVAVLVTNSGSAPVSGFQIGLSLYGETIAAENVDVTINPGDSIEYHFDATVDLFTKDFTQIFELKAYTILGNDYIPENDTNTWNKLVYGDYASAPGWETYTVCDGLPHRSVWAITEGLDGSLYFATFWGVLKVGESGQEILHNQNVLGNSYNWALLTDSQGNIWFPGTEGDITVFDGTNYNHLYPDAVFEECIFEDASGNMWFGSWNYNGLAKYDGTNWTYYTSADGLLSNRVVSISQEPGGNLLVATESGVNQFDGTNWSEYAVNSNTGLYIPEIFTDSQGRIWFAGNNLFMFDGTNWHDFTTDNGVFGWSEDIDEDNFGNIWFGGNDEIAYYNGTDWNFLNAENGLLGNVFALEADQYGDIWLGVQNVGVQKINFTSTSTGLVENFNDGDLDGWSSDPEIILTNIDSSHLELNIDKTAWAAAYYEFPLKLDLSENPYLSVRMNADSDVHVMFSYIDVNGVWADGNNEGFDLIAGDEQHFFIDFTDRWFNWESINMHSDTITGIAINFNGDQAYTGTINMSVLKFGDQAEMPYVNPNATGLTENFDDQNADGWDGGENFTFDASGSELLVTGSKSGWVPFNFNLPVTLNLIDNPYLSLRIKTDQDINARFTLHDVHGSWSDGNNPGFQISGSGEYHDIFMDYSDTWYRYDGWEVDAGNIVKLDGLINLDGEFDGTIYLDDIQLGDSAMLPVYDITLLVDMNYQIENGLFDPEVDYVDVAGSFNNWNGSGAMDDSDGDGIYAQTFAFQYDEYIEYKFRKNGSWDEGSHELYGAPNRMYTVKNGDDVYHLYNDQFNDIQAIWFDEPISSCVYNEPAAVSVKIWNSGTSVVNNFDIALRVDGHEIAVEHAELVINPGDTAVYSFNATIDLYHNEFLRFYNIEIHTMLANDQIPGNDQYFWNKPVYGDYTDRSGWTSYTVCNGLIHRSIFSVEEDNSGNIWASGFFGISVFDGTNWTYFTEENGLANNYVWSMLKDSQGNMWLPGTEDGTIAKYDGTNFTYYNPEGIFAEHVFEDADGNIWFASYDNSGVAKFDGSTFTYYTTTDGLLGDVVHNIGQDADGNMLFATDYGVSRFDGTNWSQVDVNGNNFWVARIFKDSQNRMWYAGNKVAMFDGTNWTDFTDQDGIQTGYPAIDEDIYGNIWIADGIHLYKYGGFGWKTYSPEDGMIPGQGNYGLKADSNGEIWIGSYNGGLSRLNPAEYITGLVDDFDDNNFGGWSGGDEFVFDASNSELQVQANKTGWVPFFFHFPNELNLLNHPYLSVRIKSDQDVNARFTLADNKGSWTDGDNPGFQIPGDGQYHEYFIDYSHRWYRYDGLEVDPEHIVSVDVMLNLDGDFNGNIIIDDLRIGDQVMLPFYDISFNVNMNYQIDKGTFNPVDDFVDMPASFNNWNGSDPLDDSDGDGIYSATYTFQHGEYHEYKFRMNGDWDQPHDFPDGGYNRSVYVRQNHELMHWFNDEYNDLKVIRFDQPFGACAQGTNAPVAVKITNLGVEAINGFDIGLQANGVEIAIESSDQIINPGDTIVYNFASTLDLYHNNFSRRYLLKAYTISDMDYISQNDTSIWNKFVYGDYTDMPNWTSFTICDGLADWTVFAVEQDNNGNIWASGFRGVSVYDGENWTYYNAENQLPVDYIWTMYKDSQGNMWLPSANDTIVSVFDGTSFTYHHLNATYEECVYEDNNGNIWIGSWDYYGLAMYDGSAWTYYNMEHGLAGNRITSISSDADGNVIASTDGGTSVFNGSTWEEYLVNGEGGIYVNEMFKDSQNRIWFMGNTMLMFDGSTWFNFTESNGINQWIEQADEDQSGNIWFTGGNSLLKYDGANWEELTQADGMIPGNSNFDVFVDSNDDVWVASYQGGLSKYTQIKHADVTLNVNMNVQIELGLFDPSVDFVDVAGSFNDWAGSDALTETDSGIYSITIPGLVVGDTLQYKFRKNASWNSDSHEFPDGGPNRKYGVNDGENVVDHWYNDLDYSVFENDISITALAFDAFCQPGTEEQISISIKNNGNSAQTGFTAELFVDGSLISTEEVGLNINPGESIEFTFTTPVNLYTGDFVKNYFVTAVVTNVNDLINDNDTLFRNLKVYGDYADPDGWTSFTECNGLLHSGVFALAKDKQNRIWASGFRGISVYDGSAWDYFTIEDGLPVNYYWAITNDADGNIWMPSVGDSSILMYDGTLFTLHEVDGIFDECIFVDPDGNIWAGSWDNFGLAKYDGTAWTYYSESDGLLSNSVVSIAQDKDGKYAFATNSGVSKFDGTTWSEFTVNGENGTYVPEIYLDSQNRLWMNNNSGLQMFDGTNWTNYTTTAGVSSHIEDIDEDPSGRVWFAGGQSASIFDGTQWTVVTGDVESTSIYALMLDHNGDAWFGTYLNGLFMYDAQYPDNVSVTFNYNMNYQIELQNFIVETDFVDLAGSFNDWSGVVLEDTDADGIYSTTIAGINAGDTLEFKARINGDWETSEFPGGGPNRTYTVVEGDNILDLWYNDDYPDYIPAKSSIDSEFELFPVPSSGIVNIRFNGQADNFTIEIVNGNGRIIEQEKLNIDTGTIKQFNLSEEKAGIYLIRIYNENNSVIKRVVLN